MHFMFAVFYLHSDKKNQDFTVNIFKASSSKKCIIPRKSNNSLVILHCSRIYFFHVSKCFCTNSGAKMVQGKKKHFII